MFPYGIGALLRTIREAAGLTREEQARRMEAALGGRCFDPENLKRWETERRLPAAFWHETIADAYGIAPVDVRQAVAASRRHRRERSKEETDVDRPRFIGAVATTAGLSVLPGIAQARQGIDGGLAGDGSGDLEYLSAAFERHRGGYHGRAPGLVLGEMRQDLDLLGEVLNRPHTARDRTELARTAAGIAGLVAIVQHGRSDQVDAHRWFSTATRAARESSDRRMTAWGLTRHAMVPLNYGAAGQAARLASLARREAGAVPSAAAALATAVSARALAALGDTEGARQAVNDVRDLAEALDGPDTADTWFGYPRQKHHVHLSQAYVLLGDTRSAYGAQDSALALTTSPSVMTRALLVLDTAACLNTDGDPAGAASMAAAVLDRLPAGYRQGLVRSRAEDLHRRLAGGPRDHLGQALA
ncbi:helix-turn-helix domain-containing protein [Streptomyces sp. NPDC014656]|uniref:helix-turn-helix domain-containing protein n=1 Tax=Streptomyces sp. NPDC014656 TaxID=3364878 RepID=UPI0036F770A7